jgi:hypothetical protein
VAGLSQDSNKRQTLFLFRSSVHLCVLPLAILTINGQERLHRSGLGDNIADLSNMIPRCDVVDGIEEKALYSTKRQNVKLPH